MARSALAVLGEANVGRVLAEAAAADVKTVLADQATLAVADAAAAATFGVVARVSVVRVRHGSCAAEWRRGQEQRQNRKTRQGMLRAASSGLAILLVSATATLCRRCNAVRSCSRCLVTSPI